MTNDLNTLQHRSNVQEQAICDTHTRHVQSMAKQAETADNLAALEEQHKKDTKKLDERTRLLALRASETLLELQSNTQSNAQAIADTNANVNNLRTANEATNERLGNVEQDVETIAATAASNTVAIAATNVRVDQVQDEVQVLARRLQTIETDHGTSISELQRLSEDTQINLEELSLEFLKFATEGVSFFITRLCYLVSIYY